MHDTVDDVLEHFGIKGMKWGVRRRRGSDGKVGGDSSNTSSSKAEGGKKGAKSGGKSKTKKKIKVADISDDDLKAAVNRMNLEKQYTQLSAELGKKSQTRGQKFTGYVLEAGVDIAKSQGKRAANAYVGKAIDDNLKKHGITPKKKGKKNKKK